MQTRYYDYFTLCALLKNFAKSENKIKPGWDKNRRKNQNSIFCKSHWPIGHRGGPILHYVWLIHREG